MSRRVEITHATCFSSVIPDLNFVLCISKVKFCTSSELLFFLLILVSVVWLVTFDEVHEQRPTSGLPVDHFYRFLSLKTISVSICLVFCKFSRYFKDPYFLASFFEI